MPAPVAPLSRRSKVSWTRADGPSHTVYLVYGLALLIYLVTALKSPAFFNGGKIESVFVLASVLGVLALSQQLVLTLGVWTSPPWTMNMGAVLIAYFLTAVLSNPSGGWPQLWAVVWRSGS